MHKLWSNVKRVTRDTTVWRINVADVVDSAENLGYDPKVVKDNLDELLDNVEEYLSNNGWSSVIDDAILATLGPAPEDSD